MTRLLLVTKPCMVQGTAVYDEDGGVDCYDTRTSGGCPYWDHVSKVEVLRLRTGGQRLVQTVCSIDPDQAHAATVGIVPSLRYGLNWYGVDSDVEYRDPNDHDDCECCVFHFDGCTSQHARLQGRALRGAVPRLERVMNAGLMDKEAKAEIGAQWLFLQWWLGLAATHDGYVVN